jgi:hypothetical protein
MISDDEIDKMLEGKSKSQPVIFREGIVLNWNMFASVVEARKRNEEIKEIEHMKMKWEPPSPFALLLSKKMPQLSPEARTLAQEEAARNERKGLS